MPYLRFIVRKIKLASNGEFEGMPWLLFHLKEDPYEQVNVAHNVVYAAKRKELNDRLKQWIHETGDSFALPEF